MHIPTGVRLVNQPRHIAHVFALVSIAGKAYGDPVQLQVTQPGGERQNIHLPPCIVDIVLARDGIPPGREHIGKAGAKCRAASMPYVQWAGRVGRNELHLYFFPSADIDMTKRRTAFQHVLGELLFHRSGKKQIDKTRARDLDFFQIRRSEQRIGKRGGDIPRAAAQRLGQLHGEIAGIIAVAHLLWAGEFYSRSRLTAPCRSSRAENFGKVGFEVGLADEFMAAFRGGAHILCSRYYNGIGMHYAGFDHRRHLKHEQNG